MAQTVDSRLRGRKRLITVIDGVYCGHSYSVSNAILHNHRKNRAVDTSEGSVQRADLLLKCERC